MGFFNDALKAALLSGMYYCNECGGLMEFENEWRDTLICPECGHSVDLDHYGFESEEEYNALYPTEDELNDCEDDEDDSGETYDEVYGELDDD